MRKSILIGLGLVGAGGLIYLASRSGPDAEESVAGDPPAIAIAPATAAAPGSEFDREPWSEFASPPDIPSPGMPEPDPRLTRIDGKVYLNDAVTLTRRMHSEHTTPMDDLSAVGTALQFYRLVFQQNPVGSLNEEIIPQLTGNNPKGIVVIPPDHPDINAKGELVDRWGTPYFFHGLTRTAMDVQSAGPDLKFGTVDDVKLGVEEEVGDSLSLKTGE